LLPCRTIASFCVCVMCCNGRWSAFVFACSSVIYRQSFLSPSPKALRLAAHARSFGFNALRFGPTAFLTLFDATLRLSSIRCPFFCRPPLFAMIRSVLCRFHCTRSILPPPAGRSDDGTALSYFSHPSSGKIMCRSVGRYPPLGVPRSLLADPSHLKDGVTGDDYPLFPYMNFSSSFVLSRNVPSMPSPHSRFFLVSPGWTARPQPSSRIDCAALSGSATPRWI